MPGERDPDPRRRSVRPGRARGRGHDAGAATPRSGGSRSRSDALEFGGFGGTLEDLGGRDAVAEDLAGRRRVADLVEIPPPDLERAQAEILGEPVDVDLCRELGLRRPEPAERAVRWRVGPRRPGTDPNVRTAVGPARVDRPATQDDRRQRAVGAAVHDHVDVLGDEGPVALDACPMGDDRRVALRRRREVLVSVVDHPDRLAGLSGEQGGVDREDRRVFLLAPEPATRLRLDDLRLLVVELERALQRLVDVVRALERAVDGDPAVLPGHRDHRVVLDVELFLVADPVRPLEDEVGIGEAFVQVARGDLVMGEDVVADERVEDGG